MEYTVTLTAMSDEGTFVSLTYRALNAEGKQDSENDRHATVFLWMSKEKAAGLKFGDKLRITTVDAERFELPSGTNRIQFAVDPPPTAGVIHEVERHVDSVVATPPQHIPGETEDCA